MYGLAIVKNTETCMKSRKKNYTDSAQKTAKICKIIYSVKK